MTEQDWLAVGAVAGVVTAIGTVAMAIAVIVTAFIAQGTLRAAKDDGRARTRPMLAAYLERELLSPGTIVLFVKNFGPSAATNVKVDFEPPAPPLDQVEAMPDSDMRKWLYGRFAEPVPVWVPGWTTSNIVRAGGATPGELDPFEVVLSYAGPDGTPYRERFPQHPDAIIKETYSNPSPATDPVKIGQQAVAALQAVVRTLRTR